MLTQKLKSALQYIGFIGALLTSIGYILIVLVLVQGLSVDIKTKSSLYFALVNGVVGLAIMQLLKIQGISFAKEIPENKDVLTRYYNTKTRDRKFHSIAFYWWTSIVKDVFIKGITICVTTFGVLYIAIQGSHDYHMLLLAIVNLLMFISFGLLSLNSAYDNFNNEHIPFIKEKLKMLEVADDCTR